MNNTYIQNKLDEFTEFQKENGIFIKYLGKETQMKFTMYDDFLFQSLTEAYNKGQTDHHNHIVEKVKDWFDSELENNKGDIKTYRNIHQDKEGVLSILQDTNPKE